MVDPDADAGTSDTVNCTALGSGDVTILGQRDGYTGYCELGIVGAGSNDTRIVTIANNIHVTGTSDGTYPALVIYGQNSVLTGKITADHDFYFWDDFNSATAIYGAASSTATRRCNPVRWARSRRRARSAMPAGAGSFWRGR